MPPLLLKLLVAILHLQLAFGDKPPIPCGLKWENMGSSYSFDTRVTVHQDELYIVKVIRNGTHIVGSYRKSKLEDIIDTENVSGIQFLSNPHNCTLKFIDSSQTVERKSYLVKVGDGGQTFVGRSTVSRGPFMNEWASGIMEDNSNKLTIRIPSEPPIESRNFQLLESTSPGLILEVTNFVFNTGSSNDQKDVAGTEIIENNSAATINQTVTHTKNITDIYRTTTTKSYIATRTTTKKTKILFWSKTKTTVEQWKDETVETFEKRETTVISVTKHISVPPYASVEACSEIVIKEEEEIPYVALGRYTAPGLSGAEVKELLIEDGVDVSQGSIVGDEVQIHVDGSFTYKMALSTNFRTNELGDPNGCIAFQKKLSKMNK